MSKNNHRPNQVDLPISLQSEPQPLTLGFDETQPIDDFSQLQMAVGEAQLNESTDHLFVSERLFKAIIKKARTSNQSIMYGDPGIRIYVPGAKEELDKHDRMSAEAYGQYLGEKANLTNRPK